MFGLTSLGAVHTAVSLVALGAGFTALIRDKEISPSNGVGRLYVVTTILTCITGFGIFQHGGFGKPHVVGVITLVVLALAWLAGRSSFFGSASRYVETVGYSATLFFHMIPAVVETATRLPVGAPLVTDRDSPVFQVVAAALFVAFVIGASLQVQRLRGRQRTREVAGPSAANPR